MSIVSKLKQIVVFASFIMIGVYTTCLVTGCQTPQESVDASSKRRSYVHDPITDQCFIYVYPNTQYAVMATIPCSSIPKDRLIEMPNNIDDSKY